MHCVHFLYMQSRDSTVFFLSIKEGYDPIGFIQTPAPVTSLMWSQNVSEHARVHTHTHFSSCIVNSNFVIPSMRYSDSPCLLSLLSPCRTALMTKSSSCAVKKDPYWR